MDQAKFEQMVSKLEIQSKQSPTCYQFKVGLLTLLGFALILLIMSFAGLALLLIGAFAMAVIMTGGKALILLVKLGKLLIFLAVPCWMLIHSSFTALLVRIPKPEGIELSRQDAPGLFSAMDLMRQRMKGPRFHHVLITDEVNAAVVQRPMLGLFGFQRNYLILGLPLMESMSEEEMLAVVAHEYGHLAGLHSSFGAYIYRLRNTWGTIQEMSSQWGGWIGRRLHGMVSWYAPYFNAYTFVLARGNEYKADSASAALASHAAAQSALKRVNLAAAHRERFMEVTYSTVKHAPTPPSDLAERWASIAAQAVTEKDAQNWLTNALQRQPHFADTHPALAQRLEALAQNDPDQTTLPHALGDNTAAALWLGQSAVTLRQKFQDEWRTRISSAWEARHSELKEQSERLATLRALTSPTDEEQIELLRLQLDLEPESDNLSALTAFNTAHPDRALSLYWEACLRLNVEDESGLGLLDRVMELDPAATQAACEKAHAYLKSRAPSRAQAYEQKWNERNEWERQRHIALESLDETHQLVIPQLDNEQVATIRSILSKHGQDIARVWLARRVIPCDTEAKTFLLGIHVKLAARLLGREGKILKELTQTEWPMHLFICNARTNKTLGSKLRTVKGAEIRLED